MELYTRVEAAKYLEVSGEAVRYYINKELLPAFKKGKTWLIKEPELEVFKQSEWFKNRSPGRLKYPDDMPRLHYFATKSRVDRIKAQKLSEDEGKH